jgi:hypothetical protein
MENVEFKLALGQLIYKLRKERKESNRTRTAVTIASATHKLRENSVYLDPKYASAWLKNIVRARKQARSL